MTFNDARARALAYRKRIDDVNRMMRDQPSLVRVATDGSGDHIAFWYSAGKDMTYNLSEAQRRIDELVKQFGPSLLQSRRSTLPLGLPI